MDWGKIMAAGDKKGSVEDYEPEIRVQEEETSEGDGTAVTLRKMQRVTGFNANALADSISKYFIVQEGFAIRISHNEE